MLTRDLPLHVLALLVYPGLVLTLAVGATAEVGATLVLAGGGVREALTAPLARLRRLDWRPGDLAAPLLAVLAATQLAAPFNPVTPVERNLLVAAVALAAVTWLLSARTWEGDGARLTLVVQVCWLVALMTPALASESLRPQALGSVALPAAIPLKVAAGLLALLCLPALLPLRDDRAAEPSAIRTLLWLPLCGLFVSLFFPPGVDDAGGVARFLGATLAAAAVAIGLAFLGARSRVARRRYPWLLAALAAAVLAIAAVTSSLT